VSHFGRHEFKNTVKAALLLSMLNVITLSGFYFIRRNMYSTFIKSLQNNLFM